jgi:MoaA/NifB/PqqE/SkfB family radical SAM enzyme
LLNNGRDVIRKLKENGLDKLSVSLNRYSKSTYEYVCKPRFANAFEIVLEFIKKAKPSIDIEITTLKIPDVDLIKVKEISENFGVSIRTREYILCFW